jgi:hypothetical protein
VGTEGSIPFFWYLYHFGELLLRGLTYVIYVVEKGGHMGELEEKREKKEKTRQHTTAKTEPAKQKDNKNKITTLDGGVGKGRKIGASGKSIRICRIRDLQDLALSLRARRWRRRRLTVCP